jgi:hypothetical protein
MGRSEWKRWVLVGLLAGATSLAGCMRGETGGGANHGADSHTDGDHQGLPLTGTGGSGGITTGGVNTFPGTDGTIAMPGAETDTSTAIPPTNLQGGEHVKSPDERTPPQNQASPGSDANKPAQQP